MKKTLAIVLALVMVLAMIPAMSAATYKVEGDSYDLTVLSAMSGEKLGSADGKLAVTAEYDFEAETADITDIWASNTKMALLKIEGWGHYMTAQKAAVETTLEVADQDGKNPEEWETKTAPAFDTDDYTLTVDGDPIDVGSAEYKDAVAVQLDVQGVGKMVTDTKTVGTGKKEKEHTNDYYKNYTATPVVVVPVALTEAGYQDSIKVVLTYTDEAGNKYVETAVINLTMKNTHAYKAEKVATITHIEAADSAVMSSYIVGSKVYLDYVDEAKKAGIKVTFADENGVPFTAIGYAYQPKTAAGAAKNVKIVTKNDKALANAYALDKSVAEYTVTGKEEAGVKFVLETKAANYATKAYDVIVREYIQEEDPKGIYFAETTKTIAMGEVYTPVVMGLKTGKPVGATLRVGNGTDAEVVDLVNSNKSVIGTREGVAYISAHYTTNATNAEGLKNTYAAASMKIIVTLPGESIPAVDPSAEIYYVTCRALNVRAGAGTSYKKVDLIHRGDAVKVVAVANGWAKLADGTYVCAKYIAK